MGKQTCADGGDAQGTVDRSVRRGPGGLDLDRPALRHGGGLLLHDRHPWHDSAPAGRGLFELARPASAPLRRPRRELGGGPDGGVRFPEDIDASVERIWQLVPGADDDVVYAGTEPGAVWKSTDRGETFELERGALGPPAPDRVGRRLRRPGLPHDPAAPEDPDSVTAAISTGGVYQTTDGGASWAPRNKGIRAEFLPGGPAVPRVRAVRAQGHPAPVAPRAAVPAEPRRGLPLRRRGRFVDLTSPTACQPTSGSRSWCTRTSPTRSSSSRSAAVTDATRRRARHGSGAPETQATPGPSSGRACPDSFYVAVMRDAMCDGRPRLPGHLLRRPQRGGLGQHRRGRVMDAGRGRPPRRHGGPGGRRLSLSPQRTPTSVSLGAGSCSSLGSIFCARRAASAVTARAATPHTSRTSTSPASDPTSPPRIRWAKPSAARATGSTWFSVWNGPGAVSIGTSPPRETS